MSEPTAQSVRWRCRIEVWTEVTAETADDARWQALDDLAFGRVSVDEAEVTDTQLVQNEGSGRS